MSRIALNGNPLGTGTVTIASPNTNSDRTVTLPDASGTLITNSGTEAVSVASLTDSGNLNFTGTGNRITGDFSNGTVANRVFFQTSTTNGNTTVGVLPNGTATITGVIAGNNSDPTNWSFVGMNATSSECRFSSGITGTGTYLPMTFYTGGSERVRVDTSGNVGIGTSTTNGTNSVSTLSSGATVNGYYSLVSGYAAAFVGVNNTGSTVRGVAANSVGLGTADTVSITFGTNNAERVRIDSSGNVGIGTSSPTNQLHVAGSSTTQVRVQMSGQADMRIISDTGYGALSLESAMPLIFRTSSTERARITSDGDFLLGTTLVGNSGSNCRMQIAYPGGGVKFGLGFRPAADNTSPIQFGNASGVTVGTISTTASATAYNTSSDYRLKHDIAPMTGALAKVAALKPVTYKWNADDSDGEGFIAHELAEVCPQAVTGEKDAVDAEGNPVYQGIDTSFLVATLTAAIKEQQAIIQELTARVQALEAKA